MKRRVAIIGGGLAGMAAALRIVEAGEQPIIIESTRRLGGRASSLTDPRSGANIDNCQHVLLGCCTNLIDFYDRLNALDRIEWHKSLYWTLGGINAPIDVIRAGWLPAPLHLSGSFRRMTILSHESKRAIRRAMLRMVRMGVRGRLHWSNRTFSDFLNDCDQPEQAVRRFWEPIIVSACNLSVDRVGADFALQVFQQGFLANRWSYTMGLARVPLSRLYESLGQSLMAAGGEVRLGVSARAIAFNGRRVTGVVIDEDIIDAAAVVAAVPPDRLEKLCSDVLRRSDARLHSLDRLAFSPILGVHLWFDQHIMPDALPHLVAIEPPCGVQWLFNKGVATDGPIRIQHLHAVISAADAWMHLDEAEIVRRVMTDIHHLLPNSIGLQPIDARAIKEKRATFAPMPGMNNLRPTASPPHSGGVENLFLAGDWCDTGWPATMEGAVRSGYAAAHAALLRLGGNEPGLAAASNNGIVPDVPPGLLANLLGMR